MNKIELPKKYRLAVFIFEFFAESLVNDPATQNTSNDFSTNFFPRCHTIKMSSNFYELEDICNFVDISEIHSIEDVIDSINEFFDDELVVEVDIDEVMNGLLYYFNGDLLDYHGNKAAWVEGLLNVDYDDDAMDKKIEAIDTIIKVVMELFED